MKSASGLGEWHNRHEVASDTRARMCIGGALELALMCDVRICSTSSKFGVPINKLGLVMAYPEIAALVRVVGPSTALEILYEGKILDAKEAKDKGLVNRVFEGSK